jgi:hypothetical protein
MTPVAELPEEEETLELAPPWPEPGVSLRDRDARRAVLL